MKTPRQLLEEIAAIGAARKGSLSPNGRGTGYIYSQKKEGQTCSVRVTGSKKISIYRKQIRAGARLKTLIRELEDVLEAKADEAIQQAEKVRTK